MQDSLTRLDTQAKAAAHYESMMRKLQAAHRQYLVGSHDYYLEVTS